VHALAPTLAALREHIFNGVIWPDFTRLPSAEHPVLEFVPFEQGERLRLAGKTFEVLCARHTVPACGFAVEGGDGWWVYTGDTGPNPALWQRLGDMKVAHLVVETAFGDEEQRLAAVSSHLCPTLLGGELVQLGGPLNAAVDVHLTHIKPGELDAVMRQAARLDSPHRIRALAVGQTFQLPVAGGSLDLAERAEDK
jgi:ribonuclease BN (tRNA processing enzyme)